MSFRSLLWRRLAPGAAICLAVGLGWPLSSNAQSGDIKFAVDIPTPPAQMQVYRLKPAQAPVAFLNEKLAVLKLPAMQVENKMYVVRGPTGRVDLDKVRVFSDTATGETHFIPNLAELVAPEAVRKAIPAERLREIGRNTLLDERFIARDVTEIRAAEPVTVMGGALTRAPAGRTPRVMEPRAVMTIVPAIRYAGGLRVYGRGSHAEISLANDGALVGALRRWRTASLAERADTGRAAQDIRADIERQLRPSVAAGGAATVDKVEVAYYDGDSDYLNPVIRFEATLRSADKRVADTRIAGYVPLGKAHEAIPDLAVRPSGPVPGTSRAIAPRRPLGPLGAPPSAGDITLGEFANQDWPTSSAYLTMANSFLAGLASGPQPVSRTIWWTAYPWQVVGPQSHNWMNAVNVAYTEPHGDYLFNTTQSNCCQPWSVTNIGTGGNPGYGAAAGGVLATWVIMSCEVVPSFYDRQNEIGGSGNGYTAFDAWWPVFQGLHNVIGFRTEMLYPDDALNYGFGSDAAHGGDVNAAWFDEVAAIANYGTYQSQHLNGHPQVRWDRASTFIDARDLGQSIFAVGAQSASSTLWNFWMGD